MQFSGIGNRRIFCTALLALTGAAGAAYAAQSLATTPSAINETQGAASGLGSSHRFPTRAAAAQHCPDDTVVWSTGPNLTYVFPTARTYGKGHGFYACKTEADDAGFQPKNQ